MLTPDAAHTRMPPILVHYADSRCSTHADLTFTSILTYHADPRCSTRRTPPLGALRVCAASKRRWKWYGGSDWRRTERFWLRPIVHLCISDANKKLLIQNPQLKKLLVEALLLDPDHPRQNQSADVKAAIQQDGAECLVQLALFEPAAAILKQDEQVLSALIYLFLP